MTALIADSVRTLSAAFYDERQIASSLQYVFGVDTQLIADNSYYVDAGRVTLYGTRISNRRGALGKAAGWC